ncbi:beta-N-acetylhexosaminidase [Paenisporosarcina indica]|uniref:beta-N-acetylhexosaminidase n=1 Tax=Paenisporosarcina indica TaxID=650093 RepID=UPI000950070E|nr:beta-N-acetylhexosaminidase [Paenisporosarcina indica]
MLKKLGFILLIILLTTIVILYLEDKMRLNGDENAEEQSQVAFDMEKPYKEDEIIESDDLIKELIYLANKGKVLDSPVIAGQTEFDELQKSWGLSKDSATTTQGIYENYLASHHVTVGHKNNLIFDVRSYHPHLHNIQLNEIKNTMGTPDETRSFVDQTTNQIILVYQINTTYQLKWILNQPTVDQPNPEVHHISVVTNVIEPQQTVAALLEEMTLEEKVGQMIVAGISGTTATKNTRSLINDYHVGGIIFYASNMKNSKQTLQLLNQIKKTNEQNSLPLFLGIDQEGGRISRLPKEITKLPTNEETGKINNPSYSFNLGSILGQELNAFGFNLNFAPVLDVNSNPDNPIIGNRSYGNDPGIVSELGIQTMKGLQSQQVISVIKHFPGHGDTAVDSHLKLPIVDKSLKELNQMELIPFKQAISNGADIVMIAHILLPKLDPKFPSSMSKPIIKDVLRKQLGFNGVVITDDMTMKAITDNFDITSSSVESIKAGSDLILVAHDYAKIVSVINSIEHAVKTGELSEDRIDESVERILNLKMKYELTNEANESFSVGDINQKIEDVLKNSQ